ncbi:ABC transporter substrate-binding protein [Actinomadura parmotrematis]|uniref:ABC transporter substrate-binding protein n=1 Tax=Actinomadura parmotrematis TaxID=2864039 RepID=A0ABS7G3F4_9ACTN|nr:ABC transporter substrate-binding protein [Actinomadura parmotrematis]MBW8487217.1 ABC transporter substrate-binding protein [Actinomadura parmotrematis]
MTASTPPRPARRRPALAAALAAALLTTAAGACSSGGGGGDGALRIVINPATPPALPLIAEKNGDFTANGVKAKITTLPSTSITTFAPALGRQYDIAWGTPADVIAAKAKGHDIKVVAAAYADGRDHEQAQVFAAKKGGVTALSGLAGKRIATPSLSGTLYLSVLTALRKNGVDPKKATLVEVPFPNMLDQLNAGRVDAVATIQPFIGAVKAAGHTPLGDPFLSIATPAVAGMWIADRAWAEKNPARVASFVKSLDAADAWATAHPADARAFLAAALKLPPQVMAKVPLPDWQSAVTPEALKPWIDAVAAAGQVNGKLPAPADLILTPQPK